MFLAVGYLPVFIEPLLAYLEEVYVTKGGNRYVTAITPTHTHTEIRHIWVTYMSHYCDSSRRIRRSPGRVPLATCCLSSPQQIETTTCDISRLMCVCDPRRLYVSCLNSRIWRVYWQLSTFQMLVIVIHIYIRFFEMIVGVTQYT